MHAVTFDHRDGGAVALVGGKAASLADMTSAGLPVAPGFTVTTRAYRDFLADTGLDATLTKALGDIDIDDRQALASAARELAAKVTDAPMPSTVRRAIVDEYQRLCDQLDCEVVTAVRSSATSEDSAADSFAGEYETYVGVSGADDIVTHVKWCWASAFTDRALRYAFERGLSPQDIEMAVVVQKAVAARTAGVMFTLSPVTGDRSRIVIEASYGLGLSVVGGEVTPDRYVVSKIGMEIIDRIPGDKHIEYLDGHSATPVDEARRHELCLSDDEVSRLAVFGRQLEEQHGRPLDIEWAVDRELPQGQDVILLQSRPETVWSKRPRTLPRGDLMTQITAGLRRPETAPSRDSTHSHGADSHHD